MDPISILFKEYDTLRSEILQRTNNSFQLLTISGAAGAALLAWLPPHSSRSACIAIGLLVMFLAWMFFSTHHDIRRAAARLRQLEDEINKRSGEELLQWENYWGGAVTGPLRSGRPKKVKLNH